LDASSCSSREIKCLLSLDYIRTAPPCATLHDDRDLVTASTPVRGALPTSSFTFAAMSGFQPHNHVPADPDAAPARPQRVNRDPPFDFTTILHSHDSHSRTPPHRGEPSFFDEAFRATPSPPPSFLDNILNPISATDPFDQYPQFSAMPPSQRNERSARLRSGFVDLTDDVPDASNSLRRSKRKEATPGPSTKRVKHNDGTALQVDNQAPSATVEKIDLSEDQQDGQDVLQKQRADAVKAQQPPEEKATTFNSFTCVICMDSPTDLTATACGRFLSAMLGTDQVSWLTYYPGHLFCHTCLMEALIAGENRSGPGEPKRSQCPVCRKVINRSKASDIIPLLLKKGLATQPRKTKVTS